MIVKVCHVNNGSLMTLQLDVQSSTMIVLTIVWPTSNAGVWLDCFVFHNHDFFGFSTLFTVLV